MKPFEVFRYNWQNNTEVRLQNPPLSEVPQTQPVDTKKVKEQKKEAFEFPYPSQKPIAGEDALMKAFRAMADEEGIVPPKSTAAILEAANRNVGG